MANTGALIFRVDPGSGTPPFRQLHESVVLALAEGRLHPGAKLPTVRALATELGLATNTVASAYRALEADGIVEGRGRAGTFVSLESDPIEAKARQLALQTAESLRAIGVSKDRALRLVSDAFEATESA